MPAQTHHGSDRKTNVCEDWQTETQQNEIEMLS